MKHNKVVVTGMSVCAPNGVGKEQFELSTLLGASGCRYIEHFDVPEVYSRAAGIIDGFYPETRFHYPTKPTTKYNLERQDKIAAFCIDESLTEAGLLNHSARQPIDLFLATAIGPMISMEYGFIGHNIQKKPMYKLPHQYYSFRHFTHHLSRMFKLGGTDVTIPTGCVGGCDAFAYALHQIRTGQSDCAIAGAVEAPISPLVVTAFGQIQATSTRDCPPDQASCPFDTRRDGFVLGEGGGMLVLESEQHAIERGATILAEIKGAGSNNNCYHMTDISSGGEHILHSCQLALNDANLSENDIDFINAHGSSTPQNDIAESKAFNQLFQERMPNIPVTSLKSQNGHALAAASAIEVVSAIMSLNSGSIPPTRNLQALDPECHLNIVTETRKNQHIKNILKTSSGFSGIHTALVLGEYGEVA